MINNADEIRFRCSSLGHLMTNDKSGKNMGEGAKTHLVDLFVSYKYGRREEVNSKFMEKGNEREEDSITLVSRVNKTFYKKNTTRLFNEFIQGEPDLFDGEIIMAAEKTIDTKTSYSAHTFFRAKNKAVDSGYKWQGVGYMWLTGAEEHIIAYCLVNSTEKLINDEKRKLSYWIKSMNYETDPEYIEKCKQIEKNHIFDLFAFKQEYPHYDFHNDTSEWKYDIPMDERIFTQTIKRDPNDIELIKKRVVEAREWMNKELFKI